MEEQTPSAQSAADVVELSEPQPAKARAASASAPAAAVARTGVVLRISPGNRVKLALASSREGESRRAVSRPPAEGRSPARGDVRFEARRWNATCRDAPRGDAPPAV